MKTRYKVLTALTLLTAGIGGIAAINKVIKIHATSKKLITKDEASHTYSNRLGDIHYKKYGAGSPVLLIHDLNPLSSLHEWDRVISDLSTKHTVYAIDLLGCGLSDKPDITYTNFVYVQLICDFIRNEIGKRTSVIVSNTSTPIVSLACRFEPDLFDKLIFVNPESLNEGMKIPSKLGRHYRFLLNTPIIGTLIYNIVFSKKNILSDLVLKNFFNPQNVSDTLLWQAFESSHLGNSPKSLFAGIHCKYTNFNSKPALSGLNNSILILSSKHYNNSKEIAAEYMSVNPSIEYTEVDKAFRYPHIENPEAFLQEVDVFI